MITDIVESEPMKGSLGKSKWVEILGSADDDEHGPVVRVPKGIWHSHTLAVNGGWVVSLYIRDDNARSQPDSSSSSGEPLA